MLRVSHCGAGRRESGVRMLRGSLVAAATAAMFSAAGAPALADEGSTHVVNLLTPVIEIESDGSHYTNPAIALAPLAASVNVALDAGISGRIKSFKVWLKFRAETSDWADFPQHANAVDWPQHLRPKSLNDDVYVSVPYGSHASYLVSYCNLQANALRQGGMTDQQIFSQDRPVEVAVISALQYEMSGVAGSFWDGFDASGVSGWQHFKKMTVVCQRHESLDAPTAGPIAGANLMAGTAQVNNATGACVLGLHGIISAAVPHLPVKFRYVDASGQQSDLKTVVTDANGLADFAHSYPLSADIKSGKIRMVGQGPVFLSNWADFESDCVAPPPQEAQIAPPKAIDLQGIATGDEVMRGGFACPAKVKIWGVVKGRASMDGHVALAADGTPKALEPYSIDDGETIAVQGDHTLSWGPTQTQQNVKFAMYVTSKQGVVVDQLEKTEAFVCRQVTSGVAQGAAGGVSTGQSQPTHSQQAAVGQLALPQALAIQAPHGVVRKGEIRLSGGAANGSYTLTFLRKNGGAYTAVNAAQLPKKMTGLTASFPLKALTGGRDWRLEVCPQKQDRTACRTSDFRLPALGSAVGGSAGGGMVPTPFVIAPGAVQ
ncbi:MAG: hypothetical protein GEU89_19370 [Kiloniellaceae bacterium]|nr:hypothetical protein [Kiloniellaceae bacterium]